MVRIRHHILLLEVGDPIKVGAIGVHRLVHLRIHHHLGVPLHLLIHGRSHPHLVLLHELGPVRGALHFPVRHLLLLIHPHLVVHPWVVAFVGRTALDGRLSLGKDVGVFFLFLAILLVIPSISLLVVVYGSYVLFGLVLGLSGSGVKGLLKIHQVNAISLFNFICSNLSVVYFLQLREDTQNGFSVHGM